MKTGAQEEAKQIDRMRSEFPSLADGVHMLSHSLGPAPRGARDVMASYVKRWERHTQEDAWGSQWWELSDIVGDRIGRIIGATPGSTLPLPNATYAMSAVGSCFDYHGDRRTIVLSALDFPSMGYYWEAQRRLGADIRIVPSDDGVEIPLERLLDAIDERTLLVAISHASYRSSHRVDAARIVERAHEVGALALLDVYQSAGVVEIDAAKWGVDFLIGGSIKWLCGGPSCGYLYVRPGLIQSMEPRLTGWFAHDDPFEFAAGAVRYSPTIRRFAAGTHSVPGLCSTLPGLEIIEKIGVKAIAAESQRRTQWMIDTALENGWPIRSPLDASRRGGTVMLGFDDPGALAASARERGLFIDWRPGVGIRISPHFFNTDDEVHETMKILAELVG